LLTLAIIGKTTLFNAATLINADISNYPFTTKQANEGIAYVCDICVCKELGLEDSPLNSACLDGWRYVPVKILDVPGLVKDAWRGKGLGNKFLTVIGQADGLIHVIDASGSINAEGEIIKPGEGNPIQDIIDIETEIEQWIAHILDHNKELVLRELQNVEQSVALTRVLSGIKARLIPVEDALDETKLGEIPFQSWTMTHMIKFANALLPRIKPTLILANKMDLPSSDKNIEILTDYYSHNMVAACSAEAELALRRAEKMGVLQYTPGQEKFVVSADADLSPAQAHALEYVEERVMNKWMRTGIQQALNILVFKILKMNMIYPVADENNFSDTHGSVLPDVYLMSSDSTPIDLAREVHSKLAENFVIAIDARTGMRLPKDYLLRHRDVIKIRTQPRSKSR